MKLLFSILLIGIVLSGCCHYNGNTIWGIGKVKVDENGNIREMECNSPVQINKL